MTTPDRRARDKDRDTAIEIVEAAWADGQLVDADRDKRVEELLRAQTLSEIDMITRDLQLAADVRPVEPEPVPAVDYGPPAPPTGPGALTVAPGAGQRVGRLPKAVFVIPLVAIVVVVVAVVGGLVVGIGSDETKSEVLTVQGYDDLLTAIDEATGSTQVFDAVLYPSYASVSIPLDARSEREGSWSWDGSELRDNDSKSTSSSPRFDLSRIDGQILVDLVDRVRPLVEDATTWYTIVRSPDADRAMIWAYASNEYGESAYLSARRDGTVVYDSTEH